MNDREAELKGLGMLFAGDTRLHQVVAPELQRMQERELKRKTVKLKMGKK